MEKALWIIAICELLRIAQNTLQLSMMLKEHEGRKEVEKKFIDNLVKTDETFAKNFAAEIEKKFAEESEVEND